MSDNAWPPPCCGSWVYDPVTHGAWPVESNDHHPACPEFRLLDPATPTPTPAPEAGGVATS